MKKRNILFLVYMVLFVFPCNKTFAQEDSIGKILWTTDWSADGKYIAVGGNLDTLKIYRANGLTLTKTFPIKGTITCVKWHPKGKLIAVATQISSDKVRIINLDNNTFVELQGISPDGARGIDWNYTGDFLAVADNDGQVFIFNQAGKQLRTIKKENTKSFTSIDWHPFKNLLVTVGDKISIFDIEGKLIKTIKHREEDVLLLCVAWHKSGSFFVTGDYGYGQIKSLLQYWRADGELMYKMYISNAEFRNLSWNFKGNRLATTSDALRIWDTHGKLISEGRKSQDYLWGVSWNKTGTQIISTSGNGKIILYDNKAQVVTTLE